MVSLDEAVIARLNKKGQHFEVLIDPYKAADLIDGKDIDILKNLAIDSVFKDANKGTHASEEALKEKFGTTDIEKITKEIVLKGDIQLTTEQRRKMKEEKTKRIVDSIVRTAMDPKTNSPHPPNRIKNAMNEAKVHIDPFKPVSEQVKNIIQKLKPIIPISTDRIRISIKIPPEYAGKAYGVVHEYGFLEKEDWQSDGSWLGIVKLNAGMKTELFEKLNDITHGNVSTKILK
ncbi:MAG: ribosome assembly factor SBDS [Candidatus Thermoplasmatota archaeon]